MPTSSVQAALDFVDGPPLWDAVRAAVELAGHAEWLAPPIRPGAARGHGLEASGWLRRRFGLGNL